MTTTNQSHSLSYRESPAKPNRFRSERARQLLAVANRLQRPSARAVELGQPARDAHRAEVDRDLRGYFELLRDLASDDVSEGDLHEAALALFAALPPIPGAGSNQRTEHESMLCAVAATWALAVGVPAYSADWRASSGSTEHEALVKAAGLFHGEAAVWSHVEDRDLQILALETMAQLLVGMGYDPTRDLVGTPVDRALTTRRLFGLIAFRTEAKHSAGGHASRETQLEELAVRIGIEIGDLDRGLRLWSARDDLAAALIDERWRYLRRIDFETPPNRVERECAATIRRVRSRGVARIEQRQAVDPRHVPNLPLGLQPYELRGVNVAVLGDPDVGATSFWMSSFPRHREIEQTGFLHGGDAVSSWQRNAEGWESRVLASTESPEGKTMLFRPRHDFPEFPVQGLDCAGGRFWNVDEKTEVHAHLWQAKGLLIFLDQRTLGTSNECDDRAAELSARIAETVRLRMDHDRSEGPLPIGIVLHKVDHPDLLGKECARLPRYEVLGLDVARELLHADIATWRRPGNMPDPGSPLKRLRQAIVQQPENNFSPRLQRLLDDFLRRFPEALSTVMRFTCRFELFLVSSVPDDAAQDPVALVNRSTYGAERPLRWLAKQLYGPFLRSAERVGLQAWERCVRTKLDFDAELLRFDRLTQIQQRLGQRLERLEQRLAGRVFVRRLLTAKIKLLEAEIKRVGQLLRTALENAANLVQAEIELKREPFRSEREWFETLRPVFTDREAELVNWQRQFTEARGHMKNLSS